MRLEIAKSSMLCAACSVRIEPGEYFADGPICAICLRKGPASAPRLISQETRLLADELRSLTDTAKETLGATEINFAGPDYIPKHDQVRLTKKLLMVFELMGDEKFRTINEIYAELDGRVAHTTISANLRHLKKEEFGSHRLNKRRRGEASGGVFEYQIIPNRKAVKAA